jgi:maltooligosyl trehalose synthase (EC 5.4.99.15)
VFDAGRATATRGEIGAFAAMIGPAGALNGLSQTVLKYTVPGVPDLYQGTEFWDLSLVDPDNRRPVDYAMRRAALAEDGDPAALLAGWQSGTVKQAIIARLLALRTAHPALFAAGSYTPLDFGGVLADQVIGFVREHEGARLVVIASRLGSAALGEADKPLIPAEAWGDTALTTPLDGSWHDVLSGHEHDGIDDIAGLLRTLPVAVLQG